MVRLPGSGLSRAVAFATTIVVMLIYHLAPPRTVVLTPHHETYPSLYFDKQWGGNSEAKWLDFEDTKWQCVLRRGDVGLPICGFSLRLSEPPSGSVNFAQFEIIYVYLSYQGNADKIKIYLRNHNPLYSISTDFETHKYNSIVLRRSEFNDDRIKINLKEFNVDDWWVDEFEIPRELGQPEFDRVTSLGIDLQGEHSLGEPHIMRFDKIVLEGAWLSPETFYLSIIVIWTLILGWDSFRQIHRLYRQSLANSTRLKQMTSYAERLQKESDRYRVLSSVDPLTGVYNRTGLASRAEEVLSEHRDTAVIGLIVFDIDFFKKINDTFGHCAGDEVLRELSGVVAASLCSGDIIARWGGEEFIVISVVNSREDIAKIGERMRQLVERHQFAQNRDLKVTISAGLTEICGSETFEKAFERADKAMYQAKFEGRNRLVFV